jgi:hypothetical protein
LILGSAVRCEFHRRRMQNACKTRSRGVEGVTRNGAAPREEVNYKYDGKQEKLTLPFNGASYLFDSAVSR